MAKDTKKPPQIGIGVKIAHDQLSGGIDKVEKDLAAFGKSPIFNAASVGFTAIGAAAAGAAVAVGVVAAAAGAAISVLTDMTLQGIENADALTKQARALNVSAQTLGEWRYAASQVGVEAEMLGDSMLAFQVQLGTAVRTGAGPVVENFRKLNWSVREFASLDADEQFLRLADAMSQMGTNAERASFLAELGMDPKTVALFSQGADAIRAAREEARELGLVLSDEQAKGINVASLEIGKLQAAWGALSDQLAAEAAPYIYAVTEALNEFIKSGGNWGDNISSGLQEAVFWFGQMADVVQKVYQRTLQAQAATTDLIAGMVWIAEQNAGNGTTDLMHGRGEPRPEAAEELRIFREELEKEADELWKAFDESMNGPDASESIDQWLQETGNKFRQAVNEWNSADGAPTAFFDKEAADATARSIVNNLQKQVDLLTMSAEQAEILRLEREGADLAIVTEIEGLQHILGMEKERLRLQEERHKHAEEEIKTAQSYFDMIRSDQEKIDEQIEEFRKHAADSGLYTEEQQAAIEAKLRSSAGSRTDNVVQAAEYGSSAAAEMIARFRTGRNVEEEIARNTASAVKEQKETNRLLKSWTGESYTPAELAV